MRYRTCVLQGNVLHISHRWGLNQQTILRMFTTPATQNLHISISTSHYTSKYDVGLSLTIACREIIMTLPLSSLFRVYGLLFLRGNRTQTYCKSMYIIIKRREKPNLNKFFLIRRNLTYLSSHITSVFNRLFGVRKQ